MQENEKNNNAERENPTIKPFHENTATKTELEQVTINKQGIKKTQVNKINK